MDQQHIAIIGAGDDSSLSDVGARYSLLLCNIFGL